MDFTKLIRSFITFVSCLLLCGTLRAATFEVQPTTLSFGELRLGESKTLSFTVTNLQETSLAVSIQAPTAFIAIAGSTSTVAQQLTLGPKEKREVQVTFPGNPRCLSIGNPITVTSGSDQVSVAVSAKLLCPELEFVGTGPTLSLQGSNIKATFPVINTGTIPSRACAGQIADENGTVVQSFNVPALSTDLPTDQQGFSFLIPTTPGTHTLTVAFDTNDQNGEAQEGNNNSRSRTINVPTPTPPPPPPPPPVTITVTKSGSGTGTVTDSAGMNCGSDCSSSVNSGTFITLKAVPSANSTFRNWSNGTGSATGCTNSTSPICRFTLSQNSEIRANFELTQ
jgi:hypothetical protein